MAMERQVLAILAYSTTDPHTVIRGPPETHLSSRLKGVPPSPARTCQRPSIFPGHLAGCSHHLTHRGLLSRDESYSPRQLSLESPTCFARWLSAILCYNVIFWVHYLKLYYNLLLAVIHKPVYTLQAPGQLPNYQCLCPTFGA